MNKCVLEKIKPETLLEAMDKTEAVLFGAHHERYGSLKKIIMLGKIEGGRKRGRPNMKCIDSIKEAIGMSL